MRDGGNRSEPAASASAATPSPRVIVPLPARASRCDLRRLVVGGGHRRDFPPLKACDVSLNINPEHEPDIVADVARIPLEDASVDSVYFEHMPYPAFTGRRRGGLGEAVRVLKPGGRLRILTGPGAPRREITSELRRLGCVGVVVLERRDGALSIRARRGRRSHGPALRRVCAPPRVLSPALERSHGGAAPALAA